MPEYNSRVVKFSDMTLAAVLEALSGPEPTPGGGTAAAIAGAMGTSLLIMVAGLARSKTNADEEKAVLAAARRALEPVRAELMRLADADAAAFDQVMTAYRKPKGTDQEKAERSAAIQAALQHATVIPLETLGACATALRRAGEVAGAGNRSAASDAGVAIGLLEAAAAGAEANVRGNLDSIKDEGFKTRTGTAVGQLSAGAAAIAGEARRRLAG